MGTESELYIKMLGERITWKAVKRIAPLSIEIYINSDGSVTFADFANEATNIAKKLTTQDNFSEKEQNKNFNTQKSKTNIQKINRNLIES